MRRAGGRGNPGRGLRRRRHDRGRLRSAARRHRRGSRDPRWRTATARQRARQHHHESTRSAAATTARPRARPIRSSRLRVVNNRLIPTCMETRSILASAGCRRHPDGLPAEPGPAHASPLDRRDGRHSRASLADRRARHRRRVRRQDAPVSGGPALPVSGARRLAYRSSGGNRAPKAINRPTMAGRTPRLSKSPSAMTAGFSA